ncbi:hypothetical protein [Sporosarcina sp. FSL K6-2383]|uniref:hypothetical protein n=1 Tax=Sporosarcina sp. FSL K6-2383 TaxID=2921556 RepID=UPI003159EF57
MDAKNRVEELERRVNDLERKATAVTAAPKITINIPENLSARETIKQLEDFQKKFVRSLPINF